jgi:hypothetical protein
LSAPSSIPDNTWRLINPKFAGHVRFAAAGALIAHHPEQWRRILGVNSADPWVVAALAQAGIYDDTAARAAFLPLGPKSSAYEGKTYRLYGGVTRLFLRRVRIHQIRDAAATVPQIGSAFRENSVRLREHFLS